LLESYYLIKPFILYSMRLRLLLSLLLLSGFIGNYTALAQVTAPSQGGEVSLILVTATTMELSFGTTGNGQGRVVAIAATNAGMPVPLAATDNTFYTANPTYSKGSILGSGFVIYNGPDHSVTVTGLNPNTYYYITNAEYNTDGVNIAYNTYGASMSASTQPGSTQSATPLPVGLTSFKGTVDAHSLATLHWTTATQQQTTYFALERSADGITFTEVGQVAATINHSQSLIHEWLDKHPLQAITYYRLREVELDGNAHYSQILALLPTPDASIIKLVNIYPNPSAGSTIQLLLQGYSGELFHLSLIDGLGRTVMTQVIAPDQSQYLISLALPQGIVSGSYILTLAGSGNPIQKRIVVSY
jgi:hypothetical protein